MTSNFTTWTNEKNEQVFAGAQPHFSSTITFAKISIHPDEIWIPIKFKLGNTANSIRTTLSVKIRVVEAINNFKLFQCSFHWEEKAKKKSFWIDYLKTDWIPLKKLKKWLKTHKKKTNPLWHKYKHTKMSEFVLFVKWERNFKLHHFAYECTVRIVVYLLETPLESEY